MDDNTRRMESGRDFTIPLRLSRRDLYGLQHAVNVLGKLLGDVPGNTETANRLSRLVSKAEHEALLELARNQFYSSHEPKTQQYKGERE